MSHVLHRMFTTLMRVFTYNHDLQTPKTDFTHRTSLFHTIFNNSRTHTSSPTSHQSTNTKRNSIPLPQPPKSPTSSEKKAQKHQNAPQPHLPPLLPPLPLPLPHHHHYHTPQTLPHNRPPPPPYTPPPPLLHPKSNTLQPRNRNARHPESTPNTARVARNPFRGYTGGFGNARLEFRRLWWESSRGQRRSGSRRRDGAGGLY